MYFSSTKNKRQVHVHNETIWQVYTESKLGPSNPKFNNLVAGFKSETDESSQLSHNEGCTTSGDNNSLEPWEIFTEGRLGPLNPKFNLPIADLKRETINGLGQLNTLDTLLDGSRGQTRVGITVPSPDESSGNSRIELRMETPVDCL